VTNIYFQNLIDLAGSERASVEIGRFEANFGVEELRRKEGGYPI
jgi:hypothetical protein